MYMEMITLQQYMTKKKLRPCDVAKTLDTEPSNIHRWLEKGVIPSRKWREEIKNKLSNNITFF